MDEYQGIGDKTKGRSEEERREEDRFVVLHNRELRAVRINVVKQMVVLRRWGVGLAVGIIIWAALLDSILIWYIVYSKQKIDALLVLLTTSPIICITVIATFVLMGLFRGFQDKDMKKLPVESIARELLSKNLQN